ncbi:hypothetical protein HU830_06070 [Lactobacillus sp. DCY120]|uniref:Uncharacterized protein n=1 Tax=Bombilactobacillus apium TaxID=2675299 RepID=A0A850R7R0_9LACO|nr:hypothetical protein [Bombilactobacillus apium]NVY96722.1 hypothetical protein [Bombilactobacillus apium]
MNTIMQKLRQQYEADNAPDRIRNHPGNYRWFAVGCVLIYPLFLALLVAPLHFQKSFPHFLVEKIVQVLSQPSAGVALGKVYLQNVLLLFTICLGIFYILSMFYIAIVDAIYQAQRYLVPLTLLVYLLLGQFIYTLGGNYYTWLLQLPTSNWGLIAAETLAFIQFSILGYLYTLIYSAAVHDSWWLDEPEDHSSGFTKIKVEADAGIMGGAIVAFVSLSVLRSQLVGGWGRYCLWALIILSLSLMLLILVFLNFNRVGLYNFLTLLAGVTLLSNNTPVMWKTGVKPHLALGLFLCSVLALYLTEWLIFILKQLTTKRRPLTSLGEDIKAVFKNNLLLGTGITFVLWLICRWG